MSHKDAFSGIMQISAKIKGELQEFALAANDDLRLVLGLGNARREIGIKVGHICVGDVVHINGDDAQILQILPRENAVEPPAAIMTGLETAGAPEPIEHVPAEAIAEPASPAQLSDGVVDISAAGLSPARQEAANKLGGIISKLESARSPANAASAEMDKKLIGLQEKMKQIPAAVRMIANALLADDEFVDALMNRGEQRRLYWQTFNSRLAEERLRRAEVELEAVDSEAVTFAARINGADHLSDPGKVVYYVKAKVDGPEHDANGNHIQIDKWIELKGENESILPISVPRAIEEGNCKPGTTVFIKTLNLTPEASAAIIQDIRQELNNESSAKLDGHGAEAAGEPGAA
ncbi:hypothetical protein [Stenotrophomonas sp. GD03657]|uniref:hypothetical protein n=1 Tax=Stenotrophomonas sp. GD03657 TaxID=2975363 RepID=UPI002449D89A|nr:hypothetical protein [Stenotrophomonas sp. GD03657]MDH2154327.1 hypothetical protein [Stenotrophomonas sp. GD03657]